VVPDPIDVPAEVRRRVGEHLARGRQKALAAETLWGHEQCAEAVALRRGALDEALAAARLLAGDGAPWTDALPALPAAEAAALAESERALAGEALPAFDAQFGPAEDARYAALGRLHATVDRALAVRAAPVEPPGVGRFAPLAVVLAMLAGGGAVLARHALREERAAAASASLEVAPGFPPGKAIDGDPATEWLLPHGQPGWIDVTVRRPRRLRAVKILNAHNRGFNDLASREYRVEAFAGERLVGSARGVFAAINPAGEWARHPIAAEGVTRVRVWVDSFHGATGGLGEIDFE
jgi:hypothetical protein